MPRATPKRWFEVCWQFSALSSVGIVLMVFFAKAGMEPGPVSASHASFKDDCQACHANYGDAPLDWVAAALTPGHGSGLSTACLECHRQGDTGLLSHGIKVSEMADMTQVRQVPDDRRSLRGTLVGALTPRTIRDSVIGCMACHGEHGGQDAAAAHLTDAQCQTCHTSQFDGYAEHPEFVYYPHHRQPRIVFTHGKHFRLHFGKSAEKGIVPPDGCGSCHRADIDGNMFVNGGFGVCADCHAGDITGDAADPGYLTFLSPPGLDLETLEEQEIGIGSWPEYAEDEPGPFLGLILRAGGYLDAGDTDTLAGLDLLDLIDAEADELEAVARLAWAFKRMLADLEDNGPELFVGIARGMGAGPGATGGAAWADLAASMPRAVVRDTIGQWYPDLRAELERLDSGEPMVTSLHEHEEPDDETDTAAWTVHGGWALGDLALLYRPTGHADRFMHGWMTFAASLPGVGTDLFEFLAHDQAPGRCAKCHSSGEPGAPRVNWMARGSVTTNTQPFADANPLAGADKELWLRSKPFSHFSHQQVVAQEGCVSCHKPDADTGFGVVDAQECAECHNKRTGLATCTTCHNYHFRIFDDEIIRQGGRFVRR